MNVIFVEPAFPDNQRQFARALKKVGARVIGIGERPWDWLDQELHGWLDEYEHVPSVTDERVLMDTVRKSAVAALGRSSGGDDRSAHPAGGQGARGLPHPRHFATYCLAVP